MTVKAHPSDPKVIKYREALKEFNEKWETKRFKRFYRQQLRKEIFPRKKKRRNPKQQVSESSFATGNASNPMSVRTLVAKYGDLNILKTQQQGLAKVLVVSTGKTFDWLMNSLDDERVIRRVLHYLSSKKYAQGKA
mmetsp:Transcript_31068/g.49956  ORF Transcript_31068/g.49956 Transcript_31068/m.49956 type:complete len:136 (+) Transcript_31068:7056-7463(+)